MGESRAARILRVLSVWLQGLRNRSLRTAQRYETETRLFLHFIGKARGEFPGGLLSTTPADVQAFVNLNPKHSQTTRALKAAVVRSLFGALVLESLLTSNPAAEVRVRRVALGRHHRAIPRSAILRVLAGMGNGAREMRDKALICLALAVGARRSEIASLKVQDIEQEPDGKAFLRFVGKGNKMVRMLLKSGLVRLLQSWLEIGGHGAEPDAPLFFNFSHCPNHKTRRVLSGQGVAFIVRSRFPGYAPHGLRGRAITDIWNNSDGNLHYAQTFARHANPATTEMVYIQAQKMEKVAAFAPDYSC